MAQRFVKILLTGLLPVAWAVSGVCDVAVPGKPASGPYLYDDARQYAPAEKALVSAVGDGWDLKIERTKTLNGWEKPSFGYAYCFTSRELMVEGKPAAFRITVTGWERDIRKASAGLDECDIDSFVGISSEWHFVYARPMSYGKTHPEAWKSLLAKVRTELGLASPSSGYICLLRPGVTIFPAGDSVQFSGEIWNVSDSAITIFRPDLEIASIYGPDGKAVSCVARANEATSTRLADGYRRGPNDCLEVGLSLPSDCDVSKVGEYRVKAAYRYGPGPGDLAESQEITFLVVPREALQPRVSLADAKAPGLCPLDLELVSNSMPGAQFSDVEVSFHPSEESTSSWYSAPAKLPGANKPVRVDLGELKWGRSVSSLGPSNPLTDVVKPGGRCRMWATFSGKLNGKRFSIGAKPVMVTVRK